MKSIVGTQHHVPVEARFSLQFHFCMRTTGQGCITNSVASEGMPVILYVYADNGILRCRLNWKGINMATSIPVHRG
jgi:hypothetical protein